MGEVVIYHNPQCTKSRQTLELLRARGIEPRVVLYLETPPSEAEIRRLLELLQMGPKALMRRHEDVYEALGLEAVSDEQALVRALHEHPVLIERPIVRIGDKAAICRPPERLLEIL